LGAQGVDRMSLPLVEVGLIMLNSLAQGNKISKERKRQQKKEAKRKK
jgi:hypothetical protein